MVKVLAGNQDETLQPQQPQEAGSAPPPGLSPGERHISNSLLPVTLSAPLPDAVSIVTQPSMVTLTGNDSSTSLLNASAPFARGASLASKPSLTSLDEPNGPRNSSEPRRTISVKPSLASLPESPEAQTGARLSPVQSAATIPNAAPISPAKTSKSATVPLAPAHDPGKWQSKIKGYRQSLADFAVWSPSSVSPFAALTLMTEDFHLFDMERPSVSRPLDRSGDRGRCCFPAHDYHLRSVPSPLL
jgi:hypothetical protein